MFEWIQPNSVVFSPVIQFSENSGGTKWHSWKCKSELTLKRTAAERYCSELPLKSKNVPLWQILSLTLIFPHLCACLRLSYPPGLYRHHEDIENMVQVLEAPLCGGKASVVLLMPFHVESLARLEKLLTLELLSKWLEKTNITSVSISLPKTNITSTLSLQVSTTFYSYLVKLFLKYRYECSLKTLMMTVKLR